MLTACGIETWDERWSIGHDLHHVATVLTACGIETLTLNYFETEPTILLAVATVLTACGIETF